MIEPIWIIAFTGHRPTETNGRSSDNLENCAGEIRSCLEQLSRKAADAGGRIELLTGVAAGADLICAEVAESLNIPVHVILPLPEEMLRADFQGQLNSDWERAERQIANAKSENSDGTFRIANGDNERPACYHESNLQLLQAADGLIAVWNGEASDGIGGTAEVVEEAQRLGIPVAIIDSSVELDATNLSNRNITDHQLNSVWSSFPEPSQTFSELLEWLTAADPKDEENSRQIGSGKSWDVYSKLDQAANASGSLFRGSLLWSIRMHFLAALLAGATAAFTSVLHHRADSVYSETLAGNYSSAKNDDGNTGGYSKPPVQPNGGSVAKLLHATPKFLTGIEFLLAFGAFALIYYMNSRHEHQKWRQTRFATELAHSLLLAAPHSDPLNPIIAKHEPAWRRFAVSLAVFAQRDCDQPNSLNEAKQRYLQGRLEDQIEYFRSYQPQAERLYKRYRVVQTIASTLAFIFIGFALVLKISAAKWVETSYIGASLAIFAPVALPLIAGGATSLLVGADASRRAERYSIMAERLTRLQNLIPGVRTQGALNRIVQEAEELLLDERIEWYAASKEAGH